MSADGQGQVEVEQEPAPPRIEKLPPGETVLIARLDPGGADQGVNPQRFQTLAQLSEVIGPTVEAEIEVPDLTSRLGAPAAREKVRVHLRHGRGGRVSDDFRTENVVGNTERDEPLKDGSSLSGRPLLHMDFAVQVLQWIQDQLQGPGKEVLQDRERRQQMAAQIRAAQAAFRQDQHRLN